MYIETCQEGMQRIFRKIELLRCNEYNNNLIAIDFFKTFLIMYNS